MILQFSSEKRRKKHKTETKSSSKVGHVQWQMVVNNVNSDIMSSVGDPKYIWVKIPKKYLKPQPGYIWGLQYVNKIPTHGASIVLNMFYCITPIENVLFLFSHVVFSQLSIWPPERHCRGTSKIHQGHVAKRFAS